MTCHPPMLFLSIPNITFLLLTSIKTTVIHPATPFSLLRGAHFLSQYCTTVSSPSPIKCVTASVSLYLIILLTHRRRLMQGPKAYSISSKKGINQYIILFPSHPAPLMKPLLSDEDCQTLSVDLRLILTCFSFYWSITCLCISLYPPPPLLSLSLPLTHKHSKIMD